jgi:hypothetical protein
MRPNTTARSFRAFLHTRVRHSGRLFRPYASAWLSWASPSRDLTPPEWSWPSPDLPSRGYRPGDRSHPERPRHRVSLRAERVCLSRGHRPSWDSLPRGTSRKFGSNAVRESPPRIPGCVTVPWQILSGPSDLAYRSPRGCLSVAARRTSFIRLAAIAPAPQD